MRSDQKSDELEKPWRMGVTGMHGATSVVCKTCESGNLGRHPCAT